MLRADLNAQGLDVMFSHENLVDVLTYLALQQSFFHVKRFRQKSIGNGFGKEVIQTSLHSV